jgi:Ser/Thr protein kinase RdoA (MazF antagonist)
MNQDILAFYKQRFNLQGASFSRIDHEDAMVALVYKIMKEDGSSLILKICSRIGDYLREIYFLNHFIGQVPVPRIIQSESLEDKGGAILMEYLPGTLLRITDFTGQLAYELGAMLAKIHLNRTIGYGDFIEPDRLNTDPRSYFTFKFEEGLEECSPYLPQGLLKQCRHYYDHHLHLLSSVDGPCIVHRDFRPGNLIVCQGHLQGIIDWAGARASFAEEDFCSMEHGEWPSDSKKSFLSGYASIRPVPDNAASTFEQSNCNNWFYS